MLYKRKQIVIILLLFFLLLWGCEEYCRRVIGGWSGNFSFAEVWTLDATEKEVIEVIKELKKENPSLRPPTEIDPKYVRDSGYIEESLDMLVYREQLKTNPTLKPPPHRPENSFGSAKTSFRDFYLHVYFYYSDTKEVIHAFTRPDSDSINTVFGFYSISDESHNNERYINADFWYLANKKQIKKFKKLILNPIKVKIKERKKIKDQLGK
ncbi:hypothetical protein V9K67_24460 [Paraflavisolibacter sp. H34]|uniref:hypothetical protein n=1 Tax=Huijunlia imazamoxiresistens TaxID=3127457 RepID=UPI00301B16AF